jgi:hypothetical protein
LKLAYGSIYSTDSSGGINSSNSNNTKTVTNLSSINGTATSQDSVYDSGSLNDIVISQHFIALVLPPLPRLWQVSPSDKYKYETNKI